MSMRTPLAFLLAAVAGATACNRLPAPVPVPAAVADADDGTGSAAPSEAVVHVPPASRAYVSVAPVGLGDGRVTVRAPAKVVFRDGAVSSVGAPVAGRVSAIHVQVGDHVDAGAPLVTLASPAAARSRAELARAHVAMSAAEDKLRRESEMVARGVGLDVERFEAKAKRDQAAAELERAEQAVKFLGSGDGDGEDVVVRSPIAGTILQRNATVGASVESGGEALLQVGDPRALWIVAEVYEGDLPVVQVGADVKVTLGTATTPVPGRVVAVGAALEQGLRRAPVYVAVDATSADLRPNTYARVAISAPSAAAVTLPVGAVLIEDGSRTVVYVEREEGAFVRREVSVGASTDDDRVQVTAGLAPGERVVVHGALLLDGSAEQLL
jgi:cobalt-zinc-cadmium efflux system membrane fusion protein